MAVENGTFSFMPSKLLSKFEHDISPLLAFIGKPDDFLLSEIANHSSFTSFWTNLGFELPQLISNKKLENVNIDALKPWGWSQLIKHKYGKYIKHFNEMPSFKTPDLLKSFYSRETSLRLINELNTHKLPDFVSIPQLPLPVSSMKSIVELFKKENGIVLKTLWSSSGRGLMFIRNKKQLNDASNWINAQIKKHGALIVETIYNKVQDASLQFEIDDGGTVRFLGLNFFDADRQGHFSKEYFHTPSAIKDLLPNDDTWIEQTSKAIIKSIQSLSIHKQYTGPIGVDTLFFKNVNNELKFYPFVEANLRCNMGLVNLHLKDLLAPDTKGTWLIRHFKTGEAPLFYQENINNYPIKVENGKIAKGFFPLTPFNTDTQFAAWGLSY